MPTRSTAGFATLALSLSLAACGAKTGLREPDIATEASTDAVADVPIDVMARDVPYVCTPGRVTLTARAADVVLVIDRSGSMNFGLSGDSRPGPGAQTRWTLLEQALRDTLPTFADRIDVGALFYPESGVNMNASCTLPDIPDIDVDPVPDNAMNVIAMVASTSPGGSTPTYAALHRAYTWFVRHPNRARARYLVLSTDGAPNCNPTLDPATCNCVGGRRGPGGACGPAGSDGCLDDARTVEAVREIANNPATAVPTYVVGIAPDADPVFSSTLTAMALAGGRPKVLANGTQTFYSVRQTGDFAAALGEIQSSIARCSFVTPSQPDDPDGLTLTLDGTAIPRDTTRVNGWDWTDASYGEVTLFGAACTRAEAGAPTLIGMVGCRDAGH